MFDYTLCIMAGGASMLGFVMGVVGVFMVLRGHSLLGDVIAHAALPGIVGAFIMTQSTNQIVLLGGGACSGLVGMLLVSLVVIHTRLKKDAVQGMMLSIFFGFGLVLLTALQKRPVYQQAVINKFLFGNVSLLLVSELRMITFVSCCVFTSIFLYWKELVAFAFDACYIEALGFRRWLLTFFTSALSLVVIVMGLQSVGVILISTLLIAPVVAARYWTSCMRQLTLLAGFLGALSGAGGVVLSSCKAGMPAGPLIVMVATVLVILSFVGTSYAKKRYRMRDVLV